MLYGVASTNSVDSPAMMLSDRESICWISWKYDIEDYLDKPTD